MQETTRRHTAPPRRRIGHAGFAKVGSNANVLHKSQDEVAKSSGERFQSQRSPRGDRSVCESRHSIASCAPPSGRTTGRPGGPYAPNEAAAANEMVIKRGAHVEPEQREEKPRSDGVRQTRGMPPEVRQRPGVSAEDQRRRAAGARHGDPQTVCEGRIARSFFLARSSLYRPKPASVGGARWVKKNYPQECLWIFCTPRCTW